jgi:hypothetical protein
VKAATAWRPEYSTPLKTLLAQESLQAGYGLHLGAAELKDGALKIFPLRRFLKELASGHVPTP